MYDVGIQILRQMIKFTNDNVYLDKGYLNEKKKYSFIDTEKLISVLAYFHQNVYN